MSADVKTWLNNNSVRSNLSIYLSMFPSIYLSIHQSIYYFIQDDLVIQSADEFDSEYVDDDGDISLKELVH